MSELTEKAMIEDVHNENCTDAERDEILNAFTYTIKRMATTLAG